MLYGNKGFYVEFDDQILQEIKNAYDNSVACGFIHSEMGGILIGRYSDDYTAAIIVDRVFCENKAKEPKYNFERDAVDLKKYNMKDLRYIGEWHTHPLNSPDPSLIDDNSMHQFAGNKKLNCPEPILVIIGKDHELAINVYTEKDKIKLRKIE